MVDLELGTFSAFRGYVRVSVFGYVVVNDYTELLI